MQQAAAKVGVGVPLLPGQVVEFGQLTQHIKRRRRGERVSSHRDLIALRQVGRDGGSGEPDHPVGAWAQSHRRGAGAQPPPVVGGHVDAVRHVTVGTEHPELVDEPGRRVPDTPGAQRREGGGDIGAPQVRQVALASLGPFGFQLRLTQVDVQPQSPLPGDVGQVEQGSRIQRVGGVW